MKKSVKVCSCSSSFILHPSALALMTYCLSLLCREGNVFLSDLRTSAGVDNITQTMPRMHFPGMPNEPGASEL